MKPLFMHLYFIIRLISFFDNISKIQVKAYLQSKGFCLKFCKTNRNCKIFILTKMVYVCYSYCSVYCLFVGWRPFISIFRRRIWGEQIQGFQSKVIWKHLHLLGNMFHLYKNPSIWVTYTQGSTHHLVRASLGSSWCEIFQFFRSWCGAILRFQNFSGATGPFRITRTRTDRLWCADPCVYGTPMRLLRMVNVQKQKPPYKEN